MADERIKEYPIGVLAFGSMRVPSYLTFWGKARPAGDGASWHPVAYHLLDVAATLQVILGLRDRARAVAGNLLGCDPDMAARLYVALAGLHDLGKFARPFQSKCPELWPTALGRLELSAIPPRSHPQDGWILWDGLLRAALGDACCIPPEADAVLLAAVFGHHGRPVCALDDGQPRIVFGDGGLEAASSCARDILDLLGPVPSVPALRSDAQARTASWHLAGLVSLADWVGSNQRWFPYRRPELPLEKYWPVALRQARRAVSAVGLAPPQPARERTLIELTGHSAATPMQEWASSVELPEGPVLIILEDVTGSGKTEAAQVLVNRLMAAGRASGAYWGMPTQATANAMYERQAVAVGRLFASDSLPSLVLAHGRAMGHPGFADSVLGTPPPERFDRLRDGADDGDLVASASCASFLAENRRAALLADLGAGTVDQALLAVLPSRFNVVRLAGLAEKVLILDEVHAYDAYMGEEVKTLLRFQATLGGSAVLLSATLRQADRRSLADAWAIAARRGSVEGFFGPASPPAPLSSGYPLATIVSTSGETCEFAVRCADANHRTVPSRLVHELGELEAHLIDAVRAGGAVAWIRNTVDGCVDAAQRLDRAGVESIVFHARFAHGDRRQREADVVRWFGPKATADERRGKLVVATQVIEQSLDLDFDCLASDLAPMDLLIQRAGRLRRHRHRDADRPVAVSDQMLVFSPVPSDNPVSGWLSGEFAGTARVYRNPGLLWKTARLLRENGCIRSPGGMRSLIEDAYQLSDVPSGLEAGTDRAMAAGGADAAAAVYAVLKVEDGYEGSAQAYLNDTEVLTRLADPMTLVRLGRVVGDKIEPWVEDADQRYAWSSSEVVVRRGRLHPDWVPEPRFRAAVARAKASWGDYEQRVVLLPLEPGGAGTWVGSLETGDGTRWYRYSLRFGLTWSPTGP